MKCVMSLPSAPFGRKAGALPPWSPCAWWAAPSRALLWCGSSSCRPRGTWGTGLRPSGRWRRSARTATSGCVSWAATTSRRRRPPWRPASARRICSGRTWRRWPLGTLPWWCGSRTLSCAGFPRWRGSTRWTRSRSSGTASTSGWSKTKDRKNATTSVMNVQVCCELHCTVSNSITFNFIKVVRCVRTF